MPRSPRVDYPGAVHHISNTGLSSRPIFERVPDIRYFLSRVARAARRGLIEIFAYCLLTTHFHILARSPVGKISTAMQRIQCEYSRYFNRRRGRRGTLYQSRYFSSLVESQVYFDNLVRYVDGNAVKAGLVALPQWHPAASVQWYIRGRGPLWLTRDVVEARAAERCGAAEFRPELYAKAFRPRLSPSFEAWILDRLTRGEGPPDPLDDLIDAAPPGVLEWMRERAVCADGSSSVGLPLVPSEDITAVVETANQEMRLLDRRIGKRSACPLEQIACVGLLRELGAYSFAQIARFVSCSQTAAMYRYRRHQARMEEDDAYAMQIADLTCRVIRRVS